MIDDNSLLKSVNDELHQANSLDNVNLIRTKYLGRKGTLVSLAKTIKDKSPSEKKVFGEKVNLLKTKITMLINKKITFLNSEKMTNQMKQNKVDITQPGFNIPSGSRHPLTIIEQEITNHLKELGFNVRIGSEVVSTNDNFTKLNIPENHPAREEQDTLYFNESLILRTHTSPVQIKVMEEMKTNPSFPIKIVVPGLVYRNDDDDATHSHQFNQMEGLWIDKKVSMVDLKATLNLLMVKLFGPKIKTNFRPSFFPFTEPSVEVDVSCLFCHQKKCRICKYTGWIEVLGSGMVHPKVLKNSGIDPKQYQGFAFGLGLDRLAMLKFKISDIRQFYTNDLRFLKQFGKEL